MRCFFNKNVLWLIVLAGLFAIWGFLAMREAAQEQAAATQQLDEIMRPLAEQSDQFGMQAAVQKGRFALNGVQQNYLAWFFAIFLMLAASIALVDFVSRNLHRPMRLRQVLAGYGFVAPAGVHLLIFSLGPILFALFISFHAWSILVPEKPFVGLANYAEVLSSDDFWNSLKNTALYTLHVPVGMAVSLGLALLLNRANLPGLGILRTIFFLPSITSFVAIAIVWQWIYNPDFGLLNYALSWLGLGPLQWLHHPGTALLSLMLMAIWVQVGYQMVIFLAGLQNIPALLYEAAIIDGAGAWQRFRHVTLPLLKPTTFFILVTSIIGSFQVFTQVYVMTEGGPLQATEVIVYHIYKNAWDYLRMGFASAMSFVLFVLIMVLTLLQFRLMGKRES